MPVFDGQGVSPSGETMRGRDGGDDPRGGDHPPAHPAHPAACRSKIKEKGKGLDREIKLPGVRRAGEAATTSSSSRASSRP